MEIWKDITNWEGLYQVSNKGRVKSLPRFTPYKTSQRLVPEKILSPRLSGCKGKDKVGYLSVILCNKKQRVQYKVHRLVAEHFIANPENLPCVLHGNDNPLCNESWNLSWGTIADNNQDRALKGRSFRPASDGNGLNSLTREDVDKIRDLLALGKKQHEIASLFGVRQTAISKIKTGKTWTCQA